MILRSQKNLLAIAAVMVLVAPLSMADDQAERSEIDTSAASPVPDIRQDDHKLKIQKRNWVVVPIPMSNPTLDTGLILGGAYFYPQTSEQKKVQPPSVSAAAVLRSSNDSSAVAIAHQSYFSEDKWRVGGIAAQADLNLQLRVPGGATIDWFVEGEIFAASMSRKIMGKWYAGILARYVDMAQHFDLDVPSVEFDTSAKTLSTGIGVNMEYDSRDKPMNSYSGRRFKVRALSNSMGRGSDNNYRSFGASFASYHSLSPTLVLAWELQGCKVSVDAPLWGACRIDLRGFSTTDYLGTSSASGQGEARWRLHRKWGAVVFAGGGYYKHAFSETRERELIPSYGIGLRYMVLESQRINVRLDYGRSTGSDAVYLSVGEAF